MRNIRAAWASSKTKFYDQPRTKKTRLRKSNKRKSNKNKFRKVLYLGIAVIAVFVGIWFAISPFLEKQTVIKEQNRLIESISSGNGEIVVNPNAKINTDFYIEETSDSEIPNNFGDLDITEEETTIETEVITGIGILTIEKINLTLPVVNGISNEHLKFAVGRVPQTAEIGNIGNAVMAGHRSYEYGHYLNRLGEMQNGDIIGYTSVNGENHSFKVFEIIEIEPDDQSAFLQPAHESIITIYTCTPIHTATHRLIIRATKINV